MLHVQTFTFNAFQENTYLLINEKSQCWIVDPGMFDTEETNFFFKHIQEQGLIPQAIINTHAHIDHILGVQACKDQYKIPFLVHAKEQQVLAWAVTSAAMFGLGSFTAPQPDSFIQEGTLLQAGTDTLEVRWVPGHSTGSILFYYEPGSWAIGGDVLFQRSIGRTDLPGGDYDTLIHSIKTQVFTLPDQTIVYPGHGPATDIASEKAQNPFLQDL